MYLISLHPGLHIPRTHSCHVVHSNTCRFVQGKNPHFFTVVSPSWQLPSSRQIVVLWYEIPRAQNSIQETPGRLSRTLQHTDKICYQPAPVTLINPGQLTGGCTDTRLEQFCSDGFWEMLLQKKALSQMAPWGHCQTKTLPFFQLWSSLKCCNFFSPPEIALPKL